jgi:uncharacterized repeat protein (TIGR02543 family)
LFAACDNLTGNGGDEPDSQTPGTPNAPGAPNQPQTTYYTVTFDANGGSPGPEPQSVAPGGKASRPPAITKAVGLFEGPVDLTALDFTFGGWYTDAACTTAWDFNTPVTGPLTLYAKWTTPPSQPPDINLSGQTGAHVLEKALSYIRALTGLAPDTHYTIVLAGNYAMPGITDIDNPNISTANAVITLIGKTPSEISLSSNGSLFYIANGELVLDNNITLKGRSTNDNSLVIVYGSSASLTMKAGAKITGNSAYSGGGVVVSDGTFTMSGGEISGNNAIDYDDDTVGIGGGVVVYDGTFTMGGGKISGNSATFGGGVVVYGSTFTMTGGEISGNSADYGGGGVGVFSDVSSVSSFTKTGGIIYGDTNAIHTPGSNENTVKYGNTWGHAVYYLKDSGKEYYRDATLNATDNISTGDTLPATSGQTVGYWTKK